MRKRQVRRNCDSDRLIRRMRQDLGILLLRPELRIHILTTRTPMPPARTGRVGDSIPAFPSGTTTVDTGAPDTGRVGEGTGTSPVIRARL